MTVHYYLQKTEASKASEQHTIDNRPPAGGAKGGKSQYILDSDVNQRLQMVCLMCKGVS